MRPYGYCVSNGYLGLVEDGTCILFPTELEYLEYLEDLNSSRQKPFL